MSPSPKPLPKSNLKPLLNTNTLGQGRSLKTRGLNVGKGASYCSVCDGKMTRERYARNFNVYGCKICGKCYFFDRNNDKQIELAFSYSDFFWEVKP